MFGQRLTPNDYAQLLRKSSVAQVAGYLKSSTRYGTVLETINENAIHRGQLEHLLKRDLFERYVRLCRFEHLNRDFYKYMLIRAEIDEILRCIMCLNSGSSAGYIINLPGYLIEHASFDLLLLAKARSFDELIDCISRTPYKEIIKNFRPPSGEPIPYTRCEVALYTYYFRYILDCVDRQFKGSTKQEMKEVVSTHIELLNLSFVIRLKVFFHYEPADVRRLLLPFAYKLSKPKMNAIIDSADQHELAEAVGKTVYGKKLQKVEPMYMEQASQRVRYEANKRLLRYSQTAPAAMYALLSLSSIELDNIVNIIEGIRYGLSAEDIEKLLIY